jgi:hypothetical protein
VHQLLSKSNEVESKLGEFKDYNERWMDSFIFSWDGLNG